MTKMKSPRTGLGYDVVVVFLHTPSLVATREVLFVAGGVHIDLSKEKSIVNCVELIALESDNVVVVDIPSYSTPKSTPYPDPIYLDQLAQKHVPYHHPHHRN